MQWKDKEKVRFSLRLPEDLHDKIKKKIEKSAIPLSVNDYIIKALFRSLDSNFPL